MSPEELLEKLARETDPSAVGVDRVRERIEASRRREQAADALLRQLPELPRGAAERVEVRLRSSLPFRTRPAGVLVPIVGGMAAAALVGAGVAAWVATRPEPTVDAPLAAELASPDRFAVYAPGNGVAVSYSGTGAIGGSQAAPHFSWDLGTLHVEVPPGRGLDVRVETREAEVHVVGTGFSVQRDALGTRVDVRHGVVEVRCAGEAAASRVEAGSGRTCAPTSAAGLLARARRLGEVGASDAEIGATLDQALAAGPDPAVAAELLAMRAERRAAAGDRAGALRDARAALDAGSGRRAELLQLGAAQALRSTGCAGAAPWLDELAVVGTDPATLAWKAACAADPRAADGLKGE